MSDTLPKSSGDTARTSRGPRPADATAYARRVGLFSGTMLVIGGIIGSGIFLNPSIVAQRTGSAGLTMGVWALGALILGVLAVVAVYLLANSTYLHALGVEGLAASKAPAADTMFVYVGAAWQWLISVAIALSTFGFLNLVILVTPRVYQAMASDGLFFRSFATLHPRFRTPVTAIVLQGAWAIALIFSGTYGQLLDYVVFADWIFFGTTAATLFVFRRRQVGASRDAARATEFRVPLYPGSVVVFVLAAVYVVAGSIASNPRNAVKGTLLLAAGVPVFLFWRRRSARG